MKTKILIIGLCCLFLPFTFSSCSKHSSVANAKTKVKYCCSMHQNYAAAKSGKCPVCNMDLVPVETPQKETVKKTVMYRSTMNPSEVSDKPGKDSMGMEMEPFEVGEAPVSQKVEGLAPINISPEKQKMIGVQTAEAEVRELKRTIRTVGKVAYDPDLYYAEEEFISSLKTYGQSKAGGNADSGAKSLLDASKFKLKLMGLSEGQVNELASKGVPDKTLLITEGSSRAWVYASIYEDDLGFVKPKMKAEITLPSVPDKIFQGQIIAVNPTLDPETRNTTARILVTNSSNILRPEVYVNVNIYVPLGKKLSVPANAVFDTGVRKVVFVDKGQGNLEPREIVVAFAADDYYAVDSGLSAGDMVVTNANFLIDSESQLKSVR
ncbi:MAG: efflux RND transporter periplasmic adaptor subunit [Elusimicrobia bacterium]|nr:efflux RND transporter periplasmic adaptor subunit [Elusimicrobiota bacterium]